MPRLRSTAAALPQTRVHTAESRPCRRVATLSKVWTLRQSRISAVEPRFCVVAVFNSNSPSNPWYTRRPLPRAPFSRERHCGWALKYCCVWDSNRILLLSDLGVNARLSTSRYNCDSELNRLSLVSTQSPVSLEVLLYNGYIITNLISSKLICLAGCWIRAWYAFHST